MITVGELRKALESFPDDFAVMVATFRLDKTSSLEDAWGMSRNGRAVQININESPSVSAGAVPVSRDVLDDFGFRVPRAGQWQVVEVAYAVDGVYLYERTVDRSLPTQAAGRCTYRRVVLGAAAGVGPENMDLAIDADEWQPIAVV